MIFFYLLISVMPMTRHPVWSGFVGEMTVIKYLGIICLGYALLYCFSRPSPPRFFETVQARFFVIFCLLAMTSYLLLAVPQPLEISPLMSYLSFLSLFFVTLVVVDSLDRLRYVLLVAIGSVGYASLHILREWQKYGGMGAGYRPGWVTGDPNYYSVSALLCLPLAFYLLRTDQPRWERWFCLGSIGLILVGLILAASRGALIGLTAASLLAVGRSQHRGRNFLLLLVVLLPLMAFAPSSPFSRLLSPDYSDHRSTERRVALLEEGLKMIQAQPLTGIGTGNFKAFSGTLAGVAHNTYVEVAAELGVPGITFFAAVLVLTITTLARVQRVTRNCGATLIYHAAEGIQTGLVGACVAIFFLSAETQKLFWLMIFVTMCLPSLATEELTRARSFRSIGLRRARAVQSRPERNRPHSRVPRKPATL